MDPSQSAPKLLSLLLFVVLLLVYGSFHHSRDWNSAVRFSLTYVIVQKGTVSITPFMTDNRGQLLVNPPTRDYAITEKQQYYCDKAPGHSWLGIPIYWLGLQLGYWKKYPEHQNAHFQYWPADYWVTWGSSGIWTALVGVLLFRWGVQLGAVPAAAMAISLVYAVGSPALAYATLNYGHATSGAMMFCTLWLLFQRSWQYRLPSWWQSLGAGTTAGWAVLCEYTLALFVFILIITLLAFALLSKTSGRWRLLTLVIVGGLPWAILLGWYHWQITGSPFVPAYRLENPAFDYHRGGIGMPIRWPNPIALRDLLLSPALGLFVYAPFLILAPIGAWRLWFLERRFLVLIITLTSISLWFLIASFPAWTGGMGIGPRFLIPLLPSLALFVLASQVKHSQTLTQTDQRQNSPPLPWSRGFWGTLLGAIWDSLLPISILIHLGLVLVGARYEMNPTQPNVIEDYLIARLADQMIEPNLGSWLLDWLRIPTSTGWPALLCLLMLLTPPLLVLQLWTEKVKIAPGKPK